MLDISKFSRQVVTRYKTCFGEVVIIENHQVCKCYLLHAISHVAVGAETDSEHMRLDLALDEAVDLKRDATGVCYSKIFVRIALFRSWENARVWCTCMEVVK